MRSPQASFEALNKEVSDVPEGIDPTLDPNAKAALAPTDPSDASESLLNPLMLNPEQVKKFNDSPDGRKLKDWIDRQYRLCRDARRPYERQWYTNLSFYMGKQYVEWSKLENKLVAVPVTDRNTPRIVVNKIRPIVRTEIAKLTSQKPTASVMPASNDDEDVFAARAGEQVWQSLYDRLEFDKTLTRAAFWLSITGNSFIKPYWDNTAYDQASKAYGDVRWAALSPFNILVPDLLEEEIQDQGFVICIYNKPVEWIEQMYRDVLPKGERIAPGRTDDDGAADPKLLGLPGGTNDAKPESALIIEMWVKPGATSLLPQGGFITMVNDRILQAGLRGIPYPHGQFPFAKIDHVPTGRFYAESVVTDLIPLQMEYNRTQSQIIEAKNRTSKPQVLYDEGSVVPERIDTTPGRWIPVRPNANRPSPLPVSDLPSYVVQFNERQQMNFEDISGQHEVSRGSAPPGVTAATAIAYLQERDDSYLATTIASLESAVQTVARQTLTMVSAYWTTERLVKCTGEDGGFEAVLLRGADIARGTDLRIESGSALPSSKSARMANVMDFMKMGYIPPQEGFELLDMPMLQQWTTRRGIDKRAAQEENIAFKMLDPMEVLMFKQQQQMLAELQPPRIDPMTGQPMPPEPALMIPINEWDNDDVHIEIHELMQKGASFRRLPPEIQEQVSLHVAEHKARRDARLMGLIPAAGPQPAGQYEPGTGPAAGAAAGAVPPPPPNMTDGTGPMEAM